MVRLLFCTVAVWATVSIPRANPLTITIFLLERSVANLVVTRFPYWVKDLVPTIATASSFIFNGLPIVNSNTGGSYIFFNNWGYSLSHSVYILIPNESVLLTNFLPKLKFL